MAQPIQDDCDEKQKVGLIVQSHQKQRKQPLDFAKLRHQYLIFRFNLQILQAF
jgi:hypothetical protein